MGTRFDRVVAEQLDALALVCREQLWSYQDLATASQAYCLGFESLAPQQPVALVFGHCAEAQIALLGALRAGVTAVPLDPYAPPSNVQVHLSACQLIVTEPEHVEWCQKQAPGVPVVAGAVELAGLSGDGALPEVTGDTQALIYLTSGTSGGAKGVVRSHRAICHQAQQLPAGLQYEPEDRQALFFSFSFAGAMPAFSGAFLVGGAICLYNLRTLPPSQLVAQLAAQSVTILHLTPSILRELIVMLQTVESDWQPRLLVLSGEKLYPRDLEMLREKLGWTCAVVNRLATSETAVVTDWQVDPTLLEPDDVVPVGYPVNERDVTILDEDGAPVEEGEIGEVVVTGDFMSLGYWRRPDLTAVKFKPAPTSASPLRQRFFTGDLGAILDNGLLAYFGRKDSMVKVRGFQVDVGEVEQVLRQIDAVVSGAVKVEEDAKGSEFLLGYITLLPNSPLGGIAVRAKLLELLPEFMVPRQIKVLPQLPLTSGGKLDYSILPGWTRDRPHGLPGWEAPQGDIEVLMAQIWADVLEIDQISRRDDFFELGGDSLLLVSVAAALKARLPVQIEETDLFGATDLVAMSALVKESQLSS